MSTITTEIDERYLKWLCYEYLADGGENPKLRRSETMIRYLFDESFHHYMPNDDNRASEGQGLRVTFIETTQIRLDRYLYFRDCSVLEMLIALSERMALELFNPMEEAEPDVARCFWEIAENLRLKPDQTNARIIHKLMIREYKENGLGGMFPLKKHKEDQRAVEIWYQMMAYINENY